VVLPGDAMLSSPGFDLASATSSFTDLTGSDAGTPRTNGDVVIKNTGFSAFMS
jgi:hypothetical protein